VNALWIAAGVAVALTTFEGVRQGVVRRAVELVGLVAIFLFASRLADLLAPRLESWIGVGESAGFYTSWAVVLIGGIVVVRLAATGLRKIVHLTIAGWLDRLGGGVLGLTFGLILASCLFLLITFLPGTEDLRDEIHASEPAELLLHFAPSLYDAAADLSGGEGFFEMLEQHIEPAAERLREQAAEAGDRISDVSN
jgi:membrane protein required for colicin V production